MPNARKDEQKNVILVLITGPKIIKVFHIETIRKFKGEYTFQKVEFPES